MPGLRRGAAHTGLRGVGRRTLAAALAIAAIAATLGMGGCGGKTALVPQLPPETGLFVEGAVDTVNHVVTIYWFGNDADGEVVGFELRFINPSTPADTQWRFTTRTDSVFTVFTPSGFTAPRFEVRALDNSGLRDPSPAFADFSFTNQPPTVTITGAPGPSDSTYASATLDWSTVDPDGDVNLVRYRVWLDGQDSTTAPLIAGRRYTVPSQDFIDGGVFRGGIRTAYVKPIDGGGRVGNTASTSWYVRETNAGSRLLIVDDLPSSNALNQSSDALFEDAAARNLAPGAWSVLRLQFNRAFRSARDLEQTFALFDAVIWYRGDQPGSSATSSDPLRDLQEGIAAYIEGGGKVLVEGRHLFRSTDVSSVTTGSLLPEMASRLFGSDRLAEHPPSGGANESATVWGINNGRILRSSVWQDSLRFAASRSGIYAFEVRDTAFVAFWARSGVLSQNNPVDLPVAVTVPHSSGGHAIALGFPLRIANGFNNAGLPGRVLDRAFQDLGLIP
jgi:hypothetical protein